MSLDLKTECIDSTDPAPLASWWAELLGWMITDDEDEDEIANGPSTSPAERERLLFCRVPESKSVKNRLHLDLTPDDQDAEVARSESLGARRVDVGQGSPTWVVLADPQGNEFCILRPRPSSEA